MFGRRSKRSLGSKFRNMIWPDIGVGRAWRFLMRRLQRLKASPHALALGFAAGAFVSFTPFLGLHFLMAAGLAFGLRGNIIAALIGTVVGNPLTFPVIWLASYNLGARMLGRETVERIDVAMDDAAGILHDGPVGFLADLWAAIEPVLMPMLFGGIPLGALCAFACYLVVRGVVTQLRLVGVRRAATTK